MTNYAKNREKLCSPPVSLIRKLSDFDFWLNNADRKSFFISVKSHYFRIYHSTLKFLICAVYIRYLRNNQGIDKTSKAVDDDIKPLALERMILRNKEPPSVSF